MTLEKCERLPSHFFPRGVCPREQFFLAQIVICVGNGEKVRLASSGFEGLGKVLGLLKGHGFVQGAMNNLEWWDTWTYIGDGGSTAHEFLPFRDRPTEELCHRRRRIIDHQSASTQEIVWSRTGDYRLHTAGVS